MKKVNKVKKVLFIISGIILALSIISGVLVTGSILNYVNNYDNVTVDGTDFTGILVLMGGMSAIGLGFLPVIVSLGVILAIWAIYGIVLLMKRMKHKIVLIIIILIVFIVIALVSTINKVSNLKNSKDGTIGSIAYNCNQSNYTVYINENGNYVQYLVLDNNYDGTGCTLLLRDTLLDERIRFSEEKSQGTDGGYYPNSIIDDYLNTNFVSRFDENLKSKIVNTPIKVSAYESIWTGGVKKDVETISRKIFILSATELNISSGMASQEGKKLKFFDDMNNIIAYNSDYNADAYWLRSAYHWDNVQAWCIGADGGYGGTAVSLEYLLRPAFTIPSDTPIKSIYENMSSMYVLDI